MEQMTCELKHEYLNSYSNSYTCLELKFIYL